MTIGISALISVVTSHAMASGLFDSVNGHEPKSPPGNGLTYGVWVSDVGPVTSSGLAATSARVILTGRIYKPFLSQSPDSIDVDMANALDTLMTAYSGAFTLTGNARCIDLLGQAGETLSARAGYQTIDRTVFRVLDITIPILINDAWNQGA